MPESKTQNVSHDTSLNEILDSKDFSKLSLESLVLLVKLQRLKEIDNRHKKEFGELQERQAKVSTLLSILKKINKLAPKGGLDVSKNEEMKKLLEEAKAMGAEIKDGHFNFDEKEKEALIVNIRNTIDNFNTKNDMQLQTVNHLMNERNETYALARLMMRPLHEAKVKTAQGIK